MDEKSETKPGERARWQAYRIDHVHISQELLRLAADDRSLERVISALEDAIRQAGERLDRVDANPDQADAIVDDECDLIEQLLGAAFVVAQTYINDVRARVVHLGKIGERERGMRLQILKTDKGHELLARGSSLHGSTLTPVEAIQAVANYWKHSDEWPTTVWDKLTGQALRTANQIRKLGLTPSSTGNLRHAAKILGVSDDYTDLSHVLAALRAWAGELILATDGEIASWPPHKGR